MARIRTIKPEFWQDEKLSECDPLTRLVFLGLIGMADDAGRLLDNVKVIDAFVFANTSDTCRDALATLSRMCRIRRGVTKSGQKVIQITNWARHQKVDKPNLAACLPEILADNEDVTIRESVANQSRISREPLAPLPTTNDLLPNTVRSAKPNRVRGYPEDFEEFWNVFPPIRKTDKRKACKAWLQAIRDTPPQAIIAATREYAESPLGQSDYAKMPATWLNGRCWEDDRSAWQRNGAVNGTPAKTDDRSTRGNPYR